MESTTILIILLMISLIGISILSYFVYAFRKDANKYPPLLSTCENNLKNANIKVDALMNAGGYETKEVSGNNGTANCSSFCNVDWSGQLKPLGWKGGVAVKAIRSNDSVEVGLDQVNPGQGLRCTCLRTDMFPFKSHTP